jgi:hypothetical protein
MELDNGCQRLAVGIAQCTHFGWPTLVDTAVSLASCFCVTGALDGDACMTAISPA